VHRIYLLVARQITVDDKGLAAIFVFGLPSSWHGNLALRCLQASLEITKVMHDEGVRGHAGVDYGPCYCGLVGDGSTRCEYTVMGGESPSLLCRSYQFRSANSHDTHQRVFLRRRLDSPGIFAVPHLSFVQFVRLFSLVGI